MQSEHTCLRVNKIIKYSDLTDMREMITLRVVIRQVNKKLKKVKRLLKPNEQGTLADLTTPLNSSNCAQIDLSNKHTLS